MKLKIRKSRFSILLVCFVCYVIGSVLLVSFGIDMYHIKQKRLAAKKYIAEECIGVVYESDKQLDKHLSIENVTIKLTLDTPLGLFVCYDTPEEKVSAEDAITRALTPGGKFQKNHKYTLGTSEKDVFAEKLIYDWFDATDVTEKYGFMSIILSLFSIAVNLIILLFITSTILESKKAKHKLN